MPLVYSTLFKKKITPKEHQNPEFYLQYSPNSEIQEAEPYAPWNWLFYFHLWIME